MSNITVIPLKKPRRLMEDDQPSSSSLEASLRQQFQAKKRLNGATDLKANHKRKKTQKKASESAPLTQGQIGEAAPVRYKRKGGYWWSKANVDDEEVEDDLIAQAISTSNHQPNYQSIQFPHISWDSVPKDEPGSNEAPTTSQEIKQEDLEFDEELEEKPSTALDPAYAVPNAMDQIGPKEEELDEEIEAQNGIAYTESQIKEEEPDYNEYNEEFYTDIKPDLLDPSLVEVIDPLASNEQTGKPMVLEVKEEEIDDEGMDEIKEEAEEDEYEATDEYTEEEFDHEKPKKSSREDAKARMKREKRWRIYAALGEMPPKGRPSFNETTILKAKVLKKFGPKAKELFSLD